VRGLKRGIGSSLFLKHWRFEAFQVVVVTGPTRASVDARYCH